MSDSNPHQAQPSHGKHRRLLVLLSALTLAMFGFGYALVPLYNALCSTLGINGKTGGAVSYNAAAAYVDSSRNVTIEFLASNNENLPWAFHPNTVRLKFHPGEIEKVSFYAKNNSNRKMTVQAIPSVTPGLAAKYLKKTECFCFTQQTLDKGEAMDMPILFHIDPDLPKYIHTITLSYTLFDVSERFKDRKSSKKAGKIS